MIPHQQLGELARQHQEDLRAQAHHHHLAKAAKAGRNRPSWPARGWSSLVWLGHFIAWRHNKADSDLAAGRPELASQRQ